MYGEIYGGPQLGHTITGGGSLSGICIPNRCEMLFDKDSFDNDLSLLVYLEVYSAGLHLLGGIGIVRHVEAHHGAVSVARQEARALLVGDQRQHQRAGLVQRLALVRLGVSSSYLAYMEELFYMELF